MSLLKEAANNVINLSYGNIITMLVPFIFAGVRIRYLGVEKAGFLILLESLIGLSFAVGGFGFSTAALRKIAILYKKRDNKGIKRTVSAVLSVSILTGAFIGILILLNFQILFEWSKTSFSLKTDAFYATIIMGGVLLVRQISQIFEVVFNSMQKYGILSILNSFFGFLTPGFGFVTILFRPTMTALALSLLLTSSLRLIVDFFLIKRVIGLTILPKIDLIELKTMFSFGKWAYVSSLSTVILDNLDRYILTNFLGSKILPYYVIGQQVVKKVHNFLASQSQFLFPMFSSEKKDNNINMKHIEDKSRWIIAFVSIIIYTGIALIAYYLLSILVNIKFANIATLPFQIACIQGILLSIDIVPYYLSYAEGCGAPNAIIPIFNGLLSALFVIILVPHFGILGASFARLWVGPTSLALVMWVMVSGNRFSLKNMFRPLVSPFLIAILWIFSVQFVNILFINSKIIYITSIILFGIVSIIIGLFLEYKLFRKNNCVQTIFKLVNLLFPNLKLKLKIIN